VNAELKHRLSKKRLGNRVDGNHARLASGSGHDMSARDKVTAANLHQRFTAVDVQSQRVWLRRAGQVQRWVVYRYGVSYSHG
jgi:hypothetical protein